MPLGPEKVKKMNGVGHQGEMALLLDYSARTFTNWRIRFAC